MREILQTLANYGIELLAGVVVTVTTTVLLPKASALIKTKLQKQQWRNVVDDLTQTCTTSVEMIEQTFVKRLKEDNGWDADMQKKALALAVSEAMRNITMETHNSLIDNSVDIKDIITRYIESAIFKTKK